MFDYLLSTSLCSSMEEYGLNVDGQIENDLVFIKEMIRGHLNTDETQKQVYISFCVKTVNSVLSIAVGFDVCAIRLFFHSSWVKQRTSTSSMKLWEMRKMALMWTSLTTLPGGSC